MPKELEELHSKIHSELHGKMNPKTNKTYSEDDIWSIAQAQFKKMQEDGEMHKKEIHCFSNFIELKEEDGEFYSYGFAATTHPDRATNGKYKGDILTKNAVSKIVNDINSRSNLVADLVSYRHDWVKEKNPNLPPVGKAVQAELKPMDNGHFGAWVKTHHNKVHPKFSDVKYEVEKGYLPGYSIEYEAKKTSDVRLGKDNYRMIDDLDLYGYGLASGRLIANPQAAIEGFTYKEITDSIQNNNEVTKMETEIKEVVSPAVKEIDAKEYEAFQKFKEFELKEKQKEEMKAMVKEALASVLPEIKVKMNNATENQMSGLVEFKEWSEIDNKEISVKEAFSRATALAIKTGAIDKWWNGQSWNGSTPKEFKTTGFDGSKIEIKTSLAKTTNRSSDTDYLQSGAELSDIYAPAITKMLNQRTTYWSLLPKVDFSGREAISWRAENVANTSAGAVAEGAPIQTGNTTRQKLREQFKYYTAGVQVTGQMIESAKSGIGDVFAAEVEAATRALLSTMNVALFGISGAFTDYAFLGLEYISASSTYTTLYGLTRSTTNLLGASGSEFAAQSSAPISKPTLRTAIRTLEINGADRNGLVFVCHPLQRDLILALLDDAQRFMTSAQIGFVGLPMFDGVPIYTDKDANNDDIFLVNFGENGVRLGVQVPVQYEDLAKNDDGRKGFLKFYGNQYALAPKQSVYMIQGLATS